MGMIKKTFSDSFLRSERARLLSDYPVLAEDIEEAINMGSLNLANQIEGLNQNDIAVLGWLVILSSRS